jgi:hypothetical protein
MTFKYFNVPVDSPAYKLLRRKLNKTKGNLLECIEFKPFYGLQTSFEVRTYGEEFDPWPDIREALHNFKIYLSARHAAGKNNPTAKHKHYIRELRLPNYATKNVKETLAFITTITDDFITQKPIAYARGEFTPARKGTLPSSPLTYQEKVVEHQAQMRMYRGAGR